MTSSARRTEGVVAQRVRSVEARDTPTSANISRFEEDRGRHWWFGSTQRCATFPPPGGDVLLGRRSRFLRPHPERIAAAALAHGHAVAHGDVREVGVHGVALAVVAGPAAVVFPARPGLGYGSGASRRGVRAREGSRRGRASVGRGRAFSARGGFARTHQCDSVISSSAAASKMVGLFSSSALMTSGAFTRAGARANCAPPSPRAIRETDGRLFLFPRRGAAGAGAAEK